MSTKKKLGIAISGMVVIVVIIAAIYGKRVYESYQFPYGSEHRCDKQLYLALVFYAEKHDGAFPSGEATSEASLSLIHTLDDMSECGYLLHRRDVPVKLVDDMFKRGELLGPETCGWNYVEGLRSDSNPELALFWDKEGLSEIGMRLSGGGHIVTFVDGRSEQIPESEWNDFMEKQEKMLAEEMAKRQPLRRLKPERREGP